LTMDPYPDLDPDPAILVIDLQDANKNFLKVHLHHFSKKSKGSHKSVGIIGFSYYFCLIIE